MLLLMLLPLLLLRLLLLLLALAHPAPECAGRVPFPTPFRPVPGGNGWETGRKRVGNGTRPARPGAGCARGGANLGRAEFMPR